MATVLQFIRNTSDFDDEATRVMGEAFDAVCKDLHDTGQPALVREIIVSGAATGYRVHICPQAGTKSRQQRRQGMHKTNLRTIRCSRRLPYPLEKYAGRVFITLSRVVLERVFLPDWLLPRMRIEGATLPREGPSQAAIPNRTG
jgi:hypothetical protein